MTSSDMAHLQHATPVTTHRSAHCDRFPFNPDCGDGRSAHVNSCTRNLPWKRTSTGTGKLHDSVFLPDIVFFFFLLGAKRDEHVVPQPLPCRSFARTCVHSEKHYMHLQTVCKNTVNQETSMRSASIDRGEQQTQADRRHACKGRATHAAEIHI